MPIDGGRSRLALVKPGRARASSSIPRTQPPAPIAWQGAWRTLERGLGRSRRSVENFGEVWTSIDFPRLLFNTIAIAIIGMIGTSLSCTLVAYGFARFRFPGRTSCSGC